MNCDTIIVLAFVLSFMAGVLIVGAVEWAVKRIKAHRQRVKRLEKENEKLKRANSFLLLELYTKGI